MFFWAKRIGVKLHFIQPGKPTQNAFVESFNGKFREYCLDLKTPVQRLMNGASITTTSGRIAHWAKSRLRFSPERRLDRLTFPHSKRFGSRGTVKDRRYQFR